MRPVSLILAPIAAAAASIAALQTTAGAGNLTLVSPAPTYTNFAPQITLTSAGNISAVSFTITGTDADGKTISETLAGPNANTVTTTRYFSTVTRVAVNGAVGTNTSVGAAVTGASKSVSLDYLAKPFAVGYSAENFTGTMTVKSQHTFSNILDPAIDPVWYDDTAAFDPLGAFTGKTANAEGSTNTPCRAIRIVNTAWTSGQVSLNLVQALAL